MPEPQLLKNLQYTHHPVSGKRFDVKRIESSRNLSEIAWSIRGEVKDIFLPRREGEDISLPSSPRA